MANFLYRRPFRITLSLLVPFFGVLYYSWYSGAGRGLGLWICGIMLTGSLVVNFALLLRQRPIR